MFCITIAISLLIALAESKDDCWSEKYGYPCCKTDVKVKTVNDQGSWGIENKNWCGIVSKNEIKKKDSEEYCWANYIGIKNKLEDVKYVKYINVLDIQ